MTEKQNELIENEALEVNAEQTTDVELYPESKDVMTMTGIDGIIQTAVNMGSGVEALEKLIELKNREEDRQCKKEFDANFAKMQTEFTPMKRSKKGDKSQYAPIDEFQKKYNPIINKYGFSYSWDEEPLEGGGLRVIMTISGYGHSKNNHKDLPVYEPDKGGTSGKPIMNVLQAEGTRSTYGYRYTFKAGFGITETDEDTDGNYTMDELLRYSVELQMLKDCTSIEELNVAVGQTKKVWQEADPVGRQLLAKVADDMRRRLT